MGRFGMFSLALLALENMMGDNFVCPCKCDSNMKLCILYGFVPALGCLIWTMCFLDLSPNQNDEKVSKLKVRLRRSFYSVLSVMVWVSFFFIDGRYVACGWSDWEAVYIKSETYGIVKWCKPTGNETSELEKHKRTLEFTSKSQVSVIML